MAFVAVFIFHAVADDIFHDALEMGPVHSHDSLVYRGLIRNVQPLMAEMLGLLARVVFQITAQVYVFPAEFHLSQIKLGKEEQRPHQAGHHLRRIQNHGHVMAALFRRIGDAVLQAAGIAFDAGQGRRQVVGNAGDELLAVSVVLIAQLAGCLELETHVFKRPACVADFIVPLDRHRMLQIAAADIAGNIPQLFQGLYDLPRQLSSQVQADANRQNNRRNRQHVKGDLQDVFRVQI